MAKVLNSAVVSEGLPDGAGVVLADGFIGGDEWSKAVGLGVGDDHAVEGIARPLLVERGAGDSRKGKVAKADAKFVFDFVLNVARWQPAAFDLMEIFKLKQNNGRDAQVGFFE